MREMVVLQIGPQILVVDIAVFNILGNFGNFNLIWCTLRKKELQSKSGCLLAINAVYQSVCLISQLVNLVVIVNNISIERRTCYPIVLPFILTCSQQATMAFAIALDLLIALIFPVRYRGFKTVPYLMILCTPSWIFALFFATYGWLMADNEVLQFCNVIFSFRPDVLSMWTRSNVAVNFGVLIVYLSIFLVLKSRRNPAAYKEYRRVIRRLSVIVLVFVFSWFAGLLGSTLLIALGVPSDVMPHLQINVSFFTLICYSQNFYVCIWRSSDYREAFIEQLNILRCRKPTNKSRLFSMSERNKSVAAVS